MVRKRGLKRGKLNKVETLRVREIKNGGEVSRTMASYWEEKALQFISFFHFPSVST